MPKISLTTFVKRYSEKPPRKEREYRKYLRPGGLDFYWPMKAGAAVMTYQGGTLADALAAVDEIQHAPLRENNKSGLIALAKFLETREGKYFEPPIGFYASPKDKVTIKVRPEFGFVEKGQRHLVTIWNTKMPEMTQSLAGIGINLMYDTVAEAEFQDCRCSLLDLRGRRLFRADARSDSADQDIQRELRWVDWLFEKFEAEEAA